MESGSVAAQQPDWPDPAEVARAYSWLVESPPLTSPERIRRLSAALRRVESGHAFLVQAGDCAEPFGPEAVAAAGEKYRLLGAMATILSGRLGIPVVTVGRIAGQFAKPRSRPTELVDGVELPAFRGLLVNSPEPDPAARVPDPRRLLRGYSTAALVRAELARLAGDARSAPFGESFRRPDGSWAHRGLWTSHEALVFDYERPLIRRDPEYGERFLQTTELPWLGERTRQLGGDHVAMLAEIANPLACKIGPAIEEAELIALCDRLDPAREPGRLTLICRMGDRQVRETLPALVRAVRRSAHRVVWVCDPMHGNTRPASAGGRKTRWWSEIVSELDGFLDVMDGEGARPGGVHLEVTGRDVAECSGGPERPPRLGFESLCDPRLNGAQSIMLAERLADRLGHRAPAAALDLITEE